MRANPSYITSPYGISIKLSELCSQRLMSSLLERTGILPSLAETEGGRRLDMYCNGKVYSRGL